MKYYYIEQGGNYASTDIESAATSAIYFKKNLRHLI